MIVEKVPAKISSRVSDWKRRGQRVGLVPTMGALHEGHLSLISRARRECDRVIVSIFVNPAQFGPDEDYLRYPRPLSRDKHACKEIGVDLLFVPSVRGMYPSGFQTVVDLPEIGKRWEGPLRPGHFRGVATVVLKLFHLCRSDRAYFGEKDFQQLQLVRRLTSDLDLPVEIVPCKTSREKDGLALSSRNIYLTPAQRRKASSIYRALKTAKALARGGEEPGRVLAAARRVLGQEKSLRIEYLAFVHPLTLEPLKRGRRNGRVLFAGRLGKIRLIDNL